MKSKIMKILVLLLLIGIVIFFGVLSIPGQVYETNNVADYGQYIGNYNNDNVRAFIQSFFPAEISSIYTSVTYHYKAKQGDTYSYEAYLEFCIPDEELFYTMMDQYACDYNYIPFAYDNSYIEYTVSNVYNIFLGDEVNANGNYQMLRAQIGKILFSEVDHRVVFVAIGHYDGGGTHTDELSFFFDRFSIDPVEFSEQAFDTEYEQEQYRK